MASIIQSLFGGGSNQNTNLPPTLSVFGGGANAPFNFGVGPFDLQSIVDAFNQNMGATKARYGQLGLGGSTMEKMDTGQAPSLTGGLPGQKEALIGKEQAQNVGNPALNPALQPIINQQLGGGGSTSTGSTGAGSLGQLAGLAGNLLGGAGGDATGTAIDSVLAGGGASDVAAGISESDIAAALPFLVF